MKIKKPNFWDYKKPTLFSYLLLPFTLPIYIKNIFLNKKSKEKSSIKKICIGNIYVGGTGKTPLAIMISRMFQHNQKKSAVIKKFYRNQLDEQILIEKYTNLICKKKRIDAIESAQSKNLDYIVFDDGLQDRSINYDLKIVCFNNVQWIGNGLLIPAGPLRESIKSLKKYDAVVINGDNSKNDKILKILKKINSELNIFESYYKASNLSDFDLSKNYVIFSGIGNNKNFVNLLNNYNFKIIKQYNFPDHYHFNRFEVNNIIKFAKENNCKIITTEKDYFRLDKEFKEKVKFLKIELEFYNYDLFYKFIKKRL